MINFKKILKNLIPIKIISICMSVLKLATNIYLILIIQKLIDYITKNTISDLTYFKMQILKYFFVLPLFLISIFFSNYYLSLIHI